jgi:hypothetical protein
VKKDNFSSNIVNLLVDRISLCGDVVDKGLYFHSKSQGKCTCNENGSEFEIWSQVV